MLGKSMLTSARARRIKAGDFGWAPRSIGEFKAREARAAGEAGADGPGLVCHP